MAQEKVQTIAITNFGGRLTRVLNGDMNSGFAKFDTSFGYDPFTKPMNLTWLAQPTSVFTPLVTSQIGVGNQYILSGGTLSGNNIVYACDLFGNKYKIAIAPYPTSVNTTWSASTIDSIIGFQAPGSLAGAVNTGQYGGDFAIFGTPKKLYFTGDRGIQTIGSLVSSNGTFDLDGTTVPVASIPAYDRANYHPMEDFAGKLIFGNGPTIGAIDTTGTVISSLITIDTANGPQYSQLNPPLPSDQHIVDIDKSVDGNYIYLTATNKAPLSFQTIKDSPAFNVGVQTQGGINGKGGVFGWNGVDQGITWANYLSGTLTALQTFYQKTLVFSNDILGANISNLDNKVLSLPNNVQPAPQAVDNNGNFITWANPETTSIGTRVGSLYYYGSLDTENPEGLYRLLRFTPSLAGGTTYAVPFNLVTRGAFQGVNSSVLGFGGGVTKVFGKHLLEVYAVSSVLIEPTVPGVSNLLSFEITSDITKTPQSGVYETQTQLFSKKVQIVQIRVYTEPTISGNGFQVDIVGSDGAVIANGTFNYSFVAGTDINKLQGSLQRINFNMNASPGYAFGIRVTNTGTTNMTIKKIEVDFTQEGR